MKAAWYTLLLLGTIHFILANTKQPNILLILADDLGFNDLDWKDESTRSALMTGYYPFRIGTQSGVFLHMEPTGVPVYLPFVSVNLRALGYKTWLVGKWHLGYCNKKFLPSERGFDYFYGYYGPQTGYFNHSAEQFHRDAGRRLRGLDLFEERSGGESEADESKDGIYSTVPKSYDVHCVAFKPRSLRRIYCGMLAAMDLAISRVVQALKATKQYENTVIIFSSDNGGGVDFGASNAPLRGEKDSLWEGGTRTNTFFHAPQFIKRFAIRKEMFHVVDYHATLLNIGGLNLKAYGDGINQWPYISTGVPQLRRQQFVYNIDNHGSAIRDGDYKLISGNADKKTSIYTGRFRLYRISTDPSESRDISREKPAILAKLKAKLSKLVTFGRKSVRATLSMRGNPELFNGTYSTGWCEA